MPIVIELKNAPPTTRREKAAKKKKNKKKRKGLPQTENPFKPRRKAGRENKPKLMPAQKLPERKVPKGEKPNMLDVAGGLKTVNVAKGGSVSKFPDLSGDGKVTQKDILMGKGVIKKRKGGRVTGRSIGPAGASIVSDDGKRIKKLKTMAQSLAQGAGKTLGRLAGVKLAGRLAKRGYGKAKK
jgi:hypothetical protein